ncbi:MAG TPA: protein kinase [Actinophytocola sp.]|jgi:serine/threonine protein kinase|nr:protein kinase [Actinophytocola sp.]
MRLVDGGTLRRRIDDDGPRAPREVATLGARVAAAPAHVHVRGIVHRDIKPSNVLTDSAGQHFLADFGLAWTTGSAQLTNSGEIVGTAYYLAPEQVTGGRCQHDGLTRLPEGRLVPPSRQLDISCERSNGRPRRAASVPTSVASKYGRIRSSMYRDAILAGPRELIRLV